MLLGFVAGVLSILSPCVLPLVPAILAGAVAEHRLAPRVDDKHLMVSTILTYFGRPPCPSS